MPSTRIVKPIDVVCDGAVVTVPFPTHAAPHAVRGEELLVGRARILLAAIRVVDEARARAAAAEREGSRGTCQLAGERGPHGPRRRTVAGLDRRPSPRRCTRTSFALFGEEGRGCFEDVALHPNGSSAIGIDFALRAHEQTQAANARARFPVALDIRGLCLLVWAAMRPTKSMRISVPLWLCVAVMRQF